MVPFARDFERAQLVAITRWRWEDARDWYAITVVGEIVTNYSPLIASADYFDATYRAVECEIDPTTFPEQYWPTFRYDFTHWHWNGFDLRKVNLLGDTGSVLKQSETNWEMKEFLKEYLSNDNESPVNYERTWTCLLSDFLNEIVKNSLF